MNCNISKICKKLENTCEPCSMTTFFKDKKGSFICPRDIYYNLHIEQCYNTDCYLYNKDAKFRCLKQHCDIVFDKEVLPDSVWKTFYDKEKYDLGIFLVRIMVIKDSYTEICYCGREKCNCSNKLKNKYFKLDQQWKLYCSENKFYTDYHKRVKRYINPYIKDIPLGYFLVMMNKKFKLSARIISNNLGVKYNTYLKLLELFKIEKRK